MAEAVCALAGCGRRFVKRNGQHRYCTPAHRVQANSLLPGRRQRYSYAHQQLRKRFEGQVAAGLATCARCGEPIAAGELWDLDHTDDGNGYLGTSHRGCNRATNTGHKLEEDDPARGVYWGEPDEKGRQSRWSRPWHDWRSEQSRGTAA